ncbi:MAG: hypothetical protein AB8B80_04345 [Marinicellaceae bacterium]
MNTNYYELTIKETENQMFLEISLSHNVKRKWYGKFSEIIYHNAIKKFNSFSYDQNSMKLTKQQMQLFFAEVTSIYQKAVFQLKIDKDLVKYKIPHHLWNTTEFILFQIRINSLHLSYENLLSFYLEEHNNFKVIEFEKSLDLLIEYNLIQNILTEDHQQFFDKNTQPHDHIYFKKYNKLIDCTIEMAQLLLKPQNIKVSHQVNSNIYYINSELY